MRSPLRKTRARSRKKSRSTSSPTSICFPIHLFLPATTTSATILLTEDKVRQKKQWPGLPGSPSPVGSKGLPQETPILLLSPPQNPPTCVMLGLRNCGELEVSFKDPLLKFHFYHYPDSNDIWSQCGLSMRVSLSHPSPRRLPVAASKLKD